LASDAVRLYEVKIIAFYLREAGKYRLDRELTIAINDADIFATAGAEPPTHIPTHRPFFCLGQHAHIGQPLGELPTDLGGSVVQALPKIRNEDQFPFKAKQRHYLVKVLHERDDFFLRAITKYRNGKFDGTLDGRLNSWHSMCKSSQGARSASIVLKDALAARSVTI
jgi:hypothetical protein